MSAPDNEVLLARVAALEAELAALKERLDEPLPQARERRIQQFMAARQNKRIRSAGELNLFQPTLFLGAGQIVVGADVIFGVDPAPDLFGGYIYIEARQSETVVEIGERVHINNNTVICAHGPGISIGADTLIGANVEILDTDGHHLTPGLRRTGQPAMAKVVVGKNVFVGSNVKILKGVEIGDNSVIGNGSVVTRSIPAGVVAAGNPARFVRSL